MSYRVIFLKEAEADIAEAITWYQTREEGREDLVLIVAVLHPKRHERHWKKRMHSSRNIRRKK